MRTAEITSYQLFRGEPICASVLSGIMLSALVLTAVPLEFRAPLRCAPGAGSFSKNFGNPRNVVAYCFVISITQW
jgi:hypothetical protein